MSKKHEVWKAIGKTPAETCPGYTVCKSLGGHHVDADYHNRTVEQAYAAGYQRAIDDRQDGSE